MSFAATLPRSSCDFFGGFAEHFSRQYSRQTDIPVVVKKQRMHKEKKTTYA
jgi:hypothetical protein